MTTKNIDYNDLIEESLDNWYDTFISIINYTKEKNFPIRESTLIKSVQQSGLFLEYIDASMQTFNIAYAAVSQNGNAYQYVKPELKYIQPHTDLNALDNMNTVFELMPNSIELRALNTSGCVLRHMPDLSNNKIIAEIASKSDGLAIQYISQELLTSHTINNVFNQATLNNPYSIMYIKSNYFSNINDYYQFALNAVKNRGELIEYVENPTAELCMEAVKNNPYAILKIATNISGEITIPIQNEINEPII